MEIIRSKTNSVVKEAKKLHLKKYRQSSYLIEGWHLLEEAENSGAVIEQVFVLEEFVDRVRQFSSIKVMSRDSSETKIAR